MLEPEIVAEIENLRVVLSAKDELLSSEQLKTYYRTFRDNFGPDVLKRLDGEALLLKMHTHGSKDSLAYWLEFKNDSEFPSLKFGGIGGGSALKYGIYYRQEAGKWMTGSPQKQIELSVEQAIARAHEHRAQLLKGVDLLAGLSSTGSDDDYLKLQQAMDQDAPEVSRMSWGRKYFTLLYPDKLDDFYNSEWERFHLIKMLQLPPSGDGRYLASGRFIEIARQLQMPLAQLTTILNRRNGPPRDYWRIGTTSGDKGESYWQAMRDGGFAAIGWDELGDLGQPEYKQLWKDAIKGRMATAYPQYAPQLAGKKGEEVFRFAAEINEGDTVVAAQGARVLGIGRVEGAYYLAAESERFRHRRPVTWLSTDEWSMPVSEGLQTTVWRFKKDQANLLAIEERLLAPVVQTHGPTLPTPHSPPKLLGVAGQIQSVLERKGQVILYGPPGTGKTYWAERAVQDLAAPSRFGRPYEALDEGQREALSEGTLKMAPCIRFCCFHPAYGYEDFLEAYRPRSSDGQMQFVERDGIFKELCRDALEDSRPFYLVIDEINRGDIPRIFGELLTVIERDKRGKPITLPLTGTKLVVPSNVYIVATMNTADRSIALLDSALRRRFGFIELMPDSSVFGTTVAGSIPLGKWLDALNSRITAYVGRDARNLQVGHSYFLEDGKPISEFKILARVILEEIVPLLEEYCYADFAALAKILGTGLIDTDKQQVRRRLFESGNEVDLENALLQPCPEISTAAELISSEQPILDDVEESDSETAKPIDPGASG